MKSVPSSMLPPGRRPLGSSSSSRAKWEKELPSAVKMPGKLPGVLPDVSCSSPRRNGSVFGPPTSSNVLNKEFKRRTKPMEIVAGERSCYTLLAFVCLKMELRWRSKPIGKVADNLPFIERTGRKQFHTKLLTVPLSGNGYLPIRGRRRSRCADPQARHRTGWLNPLARGQCSCWVPEQEIPSLFICQSGKTLP